jgi:hypothetical protein
MARLFKQTHVTEAVEGTMTSVRQILGLQSNGAPPQKAQQEKRSNGKEVIGDLERISQSIGTSASTSEAGLAVPKQVSVPMDISESEAEFQGFSSRLASSSDDDDDASSDAESDIIGIRAAESDSVSSSRSDSDIDRKLKPWSRITASSSRPTTSIEIPSLTGGGYMSGSDSDATDVEEHVAPRSKNRRGQRARQAIWEKKFKDKAKHVKNPPKKKDSRDEGWDAQKGAVDGGDKRKSKKFGGGRGGRGPSGGNDVPLGKNRAVNDAKKPKHKDDEGPLHPSWQAKKMAKQQSGGIGSFQGKKMTFD